MAIGGEVVWELGHCVCMHGRSRGVHKVVGMLLSTLGVGQVQSISMDGVGFGILLHTFLTFVGMR